MIVCSCNAIREDEIRKAAQCGARSAEGAYRSLGCEFECGSCADYAQEIVDEEHGKVVPIRAKAA
jgi:bacterioferritin-associated ferredoxin